MKTNVLGYHLKDTDVVFAGSIPSAGYLELSYENKEWGINIYVKNNMPYKALEEWNSGYHYNNPMRIKYTAPGVYMLNKYTIVGVGRSEDKELVKSIKEVFILFRKI